jgi:hypothetical protein
MPSAPVITIDSSGVAHWSTVGFSVYQWVLQNCFDDGTPDMAFSYTTEVLSPGSSYDCHGNGWGGNYRVKLYGQDANQNVIYSPTLSTNYTKLLP